jgi:hypothetical protein
MTIAADLLDLLCYVRPSLWCVVRGGDLLRLTSDEAHEDGERHAREEVVRHVLELMAERLLSRARATVANVRRPVKRSEGGCQERGQQIAHSVAEDLWSTRRKVVGRAAAEGGDRDVMSVVLLGELAEPGPSRPIEQRAKRQRGSGTVTPVGGTYTSHVLLQRLKVCDRRLDGDAGGDVLQEERQDSALDAGEVDNLGAASLEPLLRTELAAGKN